MISVCPSLPSRSRAEGFRAIESGLWGLGFGFRVSGCLMISVCPSFPSRCGGREGFGEDVQVQG